MSAFERFIVENLQLILVIAFIVLPIIFNRKRIMKKKSAEQGKMGKVPDKRKDLEQSLEGKVRKFFEELSGETTAAPPPVAKPITGEPDVKPVGWKMVVKQKATVPTEPPAFEPEPEPEMISWEEPPKEPPPVDPHYVQQHAEDHDAIIGSNFAGPAARIPDLTREKGRGLSLAMLKQMCGGNLRNAVIMKEILDKPVTLRD